jgi:hypothetical protein
MHAILLIEPMAGGAEALSTSSPGSVVGQLQQTYPQWLKPSFSLQHLCMG